MIYSKLFKSLSGIVQSLDQGNVCLLLTCMQRTYMTTVMKLYISTESKKKKGKESFLQRPTYIKSENDLKKILDPYNRIKSTQ